MYLKLARLWLRIGYSQYDCGMILVWLRLGYGSGMVRVLVWLRYVYLEYGMVWLG